MKNFVILVNSGLYGGGDVFSREELDSVFEEWSGGEVMMSDDEEEVDIDYLIGMGEMGESVCIINERMVDRGDEWVEVSVVKLNFREGEG
jgi:hypothetical protein